MRAILSVVLFLAGCATSVTPPSPSANDSAESDPATSDPQPIDDVGADRLTGEVVFDPAWPSEHREGCLSMASDDGFVELVSSEAWFMANDPDTGWFVIRDDADSILMQEHRLVTVTGRFLDSAGCREGRLFEVLAVEPPPDTDATLSVEVAGGIGATEGTVNVVRVLDPDGEPLLQQPVGPGQSMAVPSGMLTLVVFQKTCDANCGTAHGSEAECETPIEIDAGSEMTLTVLLSGEPPACALILRDGGPADLLGQIEVVAFDSAALPYEGVDRCVHVGSVVPVLPDGWSMVMTEPQPDRFDIAFVDPAGITVARSGDLVWLDGTSTDGGPPFGCDSGVRFDVSDVVGVRHPAP